MPPTGRGWNRKISVESGFIRSLKKRIRAHFFNRVGIRIFSVPSAAYLPRRIGSKNSSYSAAALVGTNCSLVFAADIMKSEILGTISERNRDPLNTP